MIASFLKMHVRESSPVASITSELQKVPLFHFFDFFVHIMHILLTEKKNCCRYLCML